MLKDEKGGPDAMLPHPRAKAKIAKTTVAPFGSSPFFPSRVSKNVDPQSIEKKGWEANSRTIMVINFVHKAVKLRSA